MEFDTVCNCGTPYNGLRGQCDECTELADLEEWQFEHDHGM